MPPTYMAGLDQGTSALMYACKKEHSRAGGRRPLHAAGQGPEPAAASLGRGSPGKSGLPPSAGRLGPLLGG